MNFRDHLGTGLWAIADKAILLLYGFAVIIVVINVLPAPEYGAFVLFQTIFIIICVLSDSIFLQPMVKFASEHRAETEEILAATFNLYSLVMLLVGLGFAVASKPISQLYQNQELEIMLQLLPLILAVNILRGIGIRILQVSYKISRIFWVDLAYYGSMILLTLLANTLGLFATGLDFLIINGIGGLFSSIVVFYFCRSELLQMPLLKVPRGEYQKLLSFAKFQTGTSVLMALQQWADVLVVGVYAPAYVVLFSAAKTLYRVFDAVREGATLLIVPVASKLHTSGERKQLSELIEKMLFIAFAVLVPISLVLALGSTTLMDVFYKGKFPGIDPVFRILILTGFTLPLSLVATNVLIGVGKVKGLFISTLIATLIFFGLNRLLVPTMQAEGAALSVFCSTSILGILTFAVMRRELSVSARGVIRRVKRIKNGELF